MSEIKKEVKKEANPEKVKKPKKKLSKSAIVLIVGLIIIAVPVIVFLSILGISALQTGTPREGSRFDNDLTPTITNDQVSSIKADLETLGSVESVDVVLSQGQLRIFIDTADTLSEEQIDSMLVSAYNKVNSALPINNYFTATSTSKMYDLQINIYTSPNASEIGVDGRQYKLLHKNSTESQYGIDDMAHPKNPALAAELEGLTETVEPEESETDGG